MIRTDPKCWHRQTFTWFERNNMLKMMVLPQLLYFLQTLPVTIPWSFLWVTKAEFWHFLWVHKAKRITYWLLAFLKDRGGIGFPDTFKYYYTVHRSRMLDWFKHTMEKGWVGLEQDMSSLPLQTLLWLCSALPPEIKSHPLTGTTSAVLKMMICIALSSQLPALMSPVIGAWEFVRGFTDSKFKASL